MTTDNKNTQEFLFVPITVAVLLILVAAFAVWGTQIGPTTQASAQAGISASEASAQEPQPEAEPVFAGDPAVGQELFVGTCAAEEGERSGATGAVHLGALPLFTMAKPTKS